MVKFKTILNPEEAVKYQNRVVCDVTELKITTNPLIGPMTHWYGSVNEEYFSILFVRGMLTISLAEREFQVGKTAVNYAMSESLVDALTDKGSVALNTDAQTNYNTILAPKEQEEVILDDIMMALNWSYAPLPNATKVDCDWLTV